MARAPRRSELARLGQRAWPTAIGACGITWTSVGLVWIQLPDGDEARTLARMAEKAGAAATASDEVEPPWVAETITTITRYLEGLPVALTAIPIDPRGISPFFARVYEATRAIPRGEVRSYLEIAAAAGSAAASRAVGQAMAKNPWPIVVPCHRVVGSGGRPGGFSAPGGLGTKARLLALEGGPTLGV